MTFEIKPMDYCLRLIMAEPENIFTFLQKIKLEHFYDKQRYRIFDTLYENYNPEIKRVSPMAWDTLSNEEKELALNIKNNIRTPPKEDINKICDMVKDDYKMVMAQNYVATFHNDLDNPKEPIDVLIRKTVAQLDSLIKQTMAEAFSNTHQAVDAALADIEARIEGKNVCVRTPFPTLDHILSGGLERGEFVVVSSLSGEGKSMLADQFCLAFTEQGLNCAMLGLEMEKEEYAKRSMSSLAASQNVFCINQNFMKRPGPLMEDQGEFVLDQLGVYAQELKKRQIFYLEPKMIDVDQFKSFCELAVSMHKVDVIFLDHMLLISGKMDQPKKVEELSIFMKNFATENNIIFVGISQMTRGTDIYNQNISNMAGGRAIEHQATTILSIGHVKSDQDPDSLEVSEGVHDSQRKINLLKARSAGRDTFIMADFEGVNARFREILPRNWDTAQKHEPQDPQGRLQYD